MVKARPPVCPMLMYTHTNENIEAILCGLDVKRNDRVLAIGGSGDQAFAMLECGARVQVIDHNSVQIGFIRTRINHLSREDRPSFLRTSHDPFLNHSKTREAIERDRYFTKDRIKIIAGNLNLLTVSGNSLETELSHSDDGSYDKIYLSNAVVSEKEQVVAECARVLSAGGLVYYNGLHLPAYGSSGVLTLHSERTEAARAIYQSLKERGICYGWSPIVLEKKAPLTSSSQKSAIDE